MSALAAFDTLPLKERLFVRGRLASAPLVEVARRAPNGRVVDLGCGHGLMVALLADRHPEREVVGLDPDPRKIDWARASVGRLPNVRLEVGTAEALAAREPEAFDAAVVCDVLYLLPRAQWRSFPPYATVKKFTVMDHDFSQETGELTPTLKVKRKLCTERYRAALDAMYEEQVE